MSSLPKSLQDNNLLIDQMKSHLNYVNSQFGQVDDKMKGLESQTSDFHLRIQNIQNTMCALKHKRYVHELIIDENDSRPVRQVEKIPTKNSDSELRSAISEAALQGIEMISQKFKPIAIQIPNQILTETLVPNDIYEAIDSHLLRDLPPIIGSSSFHSWNVSEIVDRPVETNEITIGIATSQPKPQTSTASLLEPKEVPIPPPIPPLIPPLNQEVSPQPSVAPKPDVPKPSNDLMAQLSERLGIENKEVKPKTDQIPSDKELNVEVKQVEKPKVSPKPTKSVLIDDNSSSSEGELFASKPLKSVEKPVEVVKSTVKVPEKPAQKSLLEDSDDSFDELFKQKVVVSTPKPKIEPKIEPKAPVVEAIPKTVEKVIITKPKVDKLPVEVVVKRPEPKKRSIFDTSSSEEEPEQIRPVKQITSTVNQPNLTDSEEEEMPKSVLNSVSNDFSSRLNQALLKRPSPSPSSRITVEPDEKPTITTTTPSTKSVKREPIERKKQESVASIRGKIGDSIAKAHRVSTDNLDVKKLNISKDSSSSDEATISTKIKAEDTNLIQTLKARPRPPGRNNQRSRPPIAKPPVEEEKPKVEVNEKESIKSAEVKESIKPVEVKESIKSASKVEDKKPSAQKTVTQQTSKKSVDDKKPTSQSTTKPAAKKKGLFDSDSDDPF